MLSKTFLHSFFYVADNSVQDSALVGTYAEYLPGKQIFMHVPDLFN